MPLFRPFAVILASFYFAGPLLILGEMLRPEFSIPILVLFLLWAIPLARSRFDAAARLRQPFSTSLIASSLAAAALCYAWIYLSGIGGYAFLHWDYVKHNLIFSALLEQHLPITDAMNGESYLLHYNFAYYVAPVRLYQLMVSLGLHAKLDPLLLYVYTAMLFISLFFLARARVSLLLFTVIFILAGGFDLLGMWVFRATFWPGATVPFLDITVPASLEWWGLPYAPQSFAMNLAWAPQHFFGALIGTALLFILLESGRPAALTCIDTVILLTASAYWSPYVAVGLAALALIKLAGEYGVVKRLRAEGLAPLHSWQGLAACSFAVVFALVTLLYYSAAESLSPPEPIFIYGSALDWFITYAINYAPPFVVLALILWPRVWTAEAPRNLLPTLVACLAASVMLLLVTHGRFNDWAMRATLPLSIALTLLLTQALSAGLKRISLAVLIAVLVFSSASSVSTIAQAIILPANRAPYGTFQLKAMGELASQYQGRPDSIFYRYLVRAR
jgi:hypothetical protein